MIYDSLQSFLKSEKASLAKGPIGVILLEDAIEVDSTVRHHLDRQFKSLIVVGSSDIALDAESRSVGEMISFCMEERRYSVLAYVIDLYAGDLDEHPDAVSLDDAFLDKTGYYALGRKVGNNDFAERQLDFFGGLRWRFEEHVPAPRRRIDRVAMFLAKPGLSLRADHTFNDPEYNTYACPWHHSMTIALCSFRTSWHSQQLMDFGLMEPGQWF